MSGDTWQIVANADGSRSIWLGGYERARFKDWETTLEHMAWMIDEGCSVSSTRYAESVSIPQGYRNHPVI